MSVIGVLIIALIVCLFVLYFLLKNYYKTKKEYNSLKKSADTIISKERENEKIKENLNTGNDADNVANSINILQDLADRR